MSQITDMPIEASFSAVLREMFAREFEKFQAINLVGQGIFINPENGHWLMGEKKFLAEIWEAEKKTFQNNKANFKIPVVRYSGMSFVDLTQFGALIGKQFTPIK